MTVTNKEYTANSTDNVSSTKGVRGGYIFVAPAGTALPTDYSTALPSAFKCLGFISEDGYVETVDSDSEDLTDMNGDLMDSPQTSRVERSGQKVVQAVDAAAKALDVLLVVAHEHALHHVEREGEVLIGACQLLGGLVALQLVRVADELAIYAVNGESDFLHVPS